jgi:hypothetical protein
MDKFRTVRFTNVENLISEVKQKFGSPSLQASLYFKTLAFYSRTCFVVNFV